MRNTAILICATIATVLATASAGADEISPACSSAEHRQFDFWLGAWEVRNAAGEVVGRNEISRISRGCALLENWRGAGSSEGMSINAFDVDRGRWTQRWVGAGAMLWLEGGFVGGAMVLTSPAPRTTPQGPVLDRITWTALDDGRVRQVWHVSADGGNQWQLIFEGLYSRQ